MRARARRLGLYVTALGLAFLVLSPGGEADPSVVRQAEETLLVAVATDFHHLAPSLRDGGGAFRRMAATGDGKDLENTAFLLETLERDLLRIPARLLLVTGDLSLNGEAESHRDLAERFARLEAAGLSVLVTPGNHDILNPWAREFRGEGQYRTPSVSPEEFAAIYGPFGFEEALSRDRESLSYVARAGQGLRILMLDTVRYQDNPKRRSPALSGRIGEGTRAWIRKAAEDARIAGDALVAAMHHSLIDHSPVIVRGYTVEDSGAIAELFSSLGIRLALTGHVHIQDAASYQGSGGWVYDLATNALAVYPNQFGLLAWHPREGRAVYGSRELDVEGWAREANRPEPRLLGYEGHSEAGFRAAAELMARSALGAAAGDSEALARSARAMGTLNLRYFAGREELNASDPEVELGVSALLKSGAGLLPRYANSILRDADGVSDNFLEIQLRPQRLE